MDIHAMNIRRWFLTGVSLLAMLAQIVSPLPVLADHTPDPSNVTIAGSLQSELGCAGDWDPACSATHLTYDASDGVWQGMWNVPAGSYEYKAALNDGWGENYGANAQQNGANIGLNLGAATDAKFYYDHISHWITSNQNSVIAVVPGNFQSELGCPGDWQPDCLRSWLQDPDGDGNYSFMTTALTAGNYEGKVALNETWDVNYGQGGVQNGANIPFTVPFDNAEVTFTYNSTSHVLDIQVQSPPVGPTVTLVGNLQSELGCAGDWDPACAATHLDYDAEDDVWQGTFTPPADNYEYKVALNDSWDENYGRYAQRDGANIPLGADGNAIKFYYDPQTHWVTDNRNSVIAVAPGNFQSELGCNGDWDPSCLRSWLQDPDEDGIYTFETTALPAGSYEGKVALNESWDLNYGQGGVQNGPNIPFFVPFDNARVTFEYNASTHVLSIQSDFGPDNDIAWDGLKHDSRDLLYRTPGGAVPAGTEVLIRFRTFHNDVGGVSLRVYDLNSGQHIIAMTPAATDVSCYQPGLENFTCDFWQASLDEASPNNLWYRFIVTDGSDTDYYADNTAALDGGLGSTTDNVLDNSFALMFYDPAFTAPEWAKSASIYQVFPDRFRDGRANNNPKTGDVRYDDPVIKLKWGILPEGFCRNYSDASTNCPWRFDATPPDWSPLKEGPRGRDYFGGDLKGVDQYLDYLQSLGVNTIYFNPIFDAGSNHSYDTQDYYKIDPYFGTQKDWENLVKHADQRGMRIVLDGVFNHMSSDSPIFDRYHHYNTVGACESPASPYRNWFYFHDVTPGAGACVGSNGQPNSANYDGWFGFDSIPVINKLLPAVQQYFLTNDDSVTKYWLEQGSSGWRMDVMGDASFPDGYWEVFRGEVKTTNPEAFIISETWQKDSTLLRMLRGDRADTTMNYRLRDAVLGLLSPQGFDSKGFGDSGRIISPSEFASRMESIREDYPDAAYYSLMNLLDSHDTERIQWALTPGEETRANKEFNPASVAEGKLRQKIASLIQFTVPGAPTVFYGDEVGITGDDDPDDRRTYPWADKGGSPDLNMFAHYQTLNVLRASNDVLVNGDFTMLLADDSTQVIAYGRKTNSHAALVIVNRSDQTQTGAIPVAGYLPDGVTLNKAYAVGSGAADSVTVMNGEITGSMGPMSAVLFLSGPVDLQPTPAPANLRLTNEGNATVSMEWDAVPGSAGYNLYRSPLSGGGWVKLNGAPLTGTNYTDSGLQNAKSYFYVVTSLDSAGNESEYSNEVRALPRLTIGWANLQWPPTLTHTISAVNRTENAYGQVWIDGYTDQPGPTPNLRAQLGFGPANSDPNGNADWVWYEASFNVDAGNNDEFFASMLPEASGSYDYAFRYSTSNGFDWVYADLDGIGNGYSSSQAGKMTVNPSGDTTPPAVPAGLTVLSASPAGISLMWDAVSGDPTLYGYEVLRGDISGGPYTMIARVTGTSHTDLSVVESATYYYVVRALDQSFNRSGNSSEVEATAALRTVTVVFTVTVPGWTPSNQSVHIAGTLSRFDGNYPDWSSSTVSLLLAGPNQWTITFTGLEGTQIEYKYTLGSPDFFDVEKGASCDEIANRQLTLDYGTTGTQIVNDTVLNWRNVNPCGN
jgi:glycosidase/fibronectin type 3 domain-containing protein